MSFLDQIYGLSCGTIVEIHLKNRAIRGELNLDESNLKVLMKLLKETDVCGVSFEGQDIGRHGIVAWIVLVAGKTLFPIDVFSLVELMQDKFWQVLRKNLFENAKLVKIIHDARPGVDFLLHQHRIEITNLFDTQVVDLVVFQNATQIIPTQLNPLSHCLEEYNFRIPKEEIDFLRRFESFDFSTNSPMLIRPVPDAQFLKLCALKVKHLVPLRENLMMKIMGKMTRCTKVHMESYELKSDLDYASMSKDTTSISPELQAALENN